MPYLSYDEFKAYPLGVEISEQEFETLRFYAEATIDGLVNRPIDASCVPDGVKRAAAMQIAYLAMQGGADAALGGAAQSETIGSYSYSVSTGGSVKAGSLSPMAREALLPTGLLYAGVRRVCRW